MKRRKSIPLSVKLAVALDEVRRLRGLPADTNFHFDHIPALALRPWDEDTQDTIPPANDPNALQLLTETEHSRKTNGNAATTAGSDKNRIAKQDRREGRTKTGPKRKIPSRPNPWPPKGSQKFPKQRFRDGYGAR